MSTEPAPERLTSDLLDGAIEDALLAFNEAVIVPGYTWYAFPARTELTFRLLDDDAARAAGLLD